MSLKRASLAPFETYSSNFSVCSNFDIKSTSDSFMNHIEAKRNEYWERAAEAKGLGWFNVRRSCLPLQDNWC